MRDKFLHVAQSTTKEEALGEPFGILEVIYTTLECAHQLDVIEHKAGKRSTQLFSWASARQLQHTIALLNIIEDLKEL